VFFSSEKKSSSIANVSPKKEITFNHECRTRHRGGTQITLEYRKRTDFWHRVLLGENVLLRSRHLVLWSLGTLTGQQRFYGTGLVT
jgi:hypothetical protein